VSVCVCVWCVYVVCVCVCGWCVCVCVCDREVDRVSTLGRTRAMSALKVDT